MSTSRYCNRVTSFSSVSVMILRCLFCCLFYSHAVVSEHKGIRKKIFRHAKLLLDGKSYDDESIIRGEYIFTFNSNDDSSTNSTIRTKRTKIKAMAQSIFRGRDEQIESVYTNAIIGVAVRGILSIERLTSILDDPRILVAQPNCRVSAYQTQKNAPWALDRIDQEDYAPLDNEYHYNSTGSNVSIFVMDSGIRLSHNEFGGRATCGFDIEPNNTCNDWFWHGTMVAGIAGGKTYGVAKNVNLVAVRVLDNKGWGTTGAVIAGMDYIIGRKKASPETPMIINISLGGAKSTLENSFTNAAVDAGIVVVVAAGNNNKDACFFSPASAEKAITVGGTAAFDFRFSLSNFGSCIDLFAPAALIQSACRRNDKCTFRFSGTSFASPQVAGVAALYLSQNSSMTPDDVLTRLITDASKDKVIGAGLNSPNRLLNKRNI